MKIYDGQTAKIRISEAALLKGRRCPVTKLWRIPLKANIANPNTDTLLLNSQDGQQSINPLYTPPTSKTAVHHVQTIKTKHTPETINNVYESSMIEITIRYLHEVARFQQISRGSKPSNAETVSPSHSSTSRIQPNYSLNMKKYKMYTREIKDKASSPPKFSN